MVWVGAIIVILSFILIVKRFDAKMVLFVAGFLMCALSLQFLEPLDKLWSSLFTGSIPQIISAAMGYAFLMSYSKCDLHLAAFLIKTLQKCRGIIIPGVVISGGLLVGFALGSNAGGAATLGPILIPVMIKAGIHPALAASVLAIGCQGNYFGFGAHSAMIAEISGSTVEEVTIQNHWLIGIIAYAIVIISLLIIGKVRKEDRGYIDTDGQFNQDEDTQTIEKINPVFACLPFVPVVLLLAGIIINPRFAAFPKFSVQQAMIIGTCFAILICRVNVSEAIKAFFTGVGSAITNVVSIIACAGVFTLGMEAIGLTPALITAMESNPNIAVFGAAIGPALIAFLCGSGDAATLAFNGSVTPLVSGFGLEPMNIGSIAYLCGCFGRTMSPLAGVTIIAAGFAKVNPMEISKRAIPSTLLSILATIIILGYLK